MTYLTSIITSYNRSRVSSEDNKIQLRLNRLGEFKILTETNLILPDFIYPSTTLRIIGTLSLFNQL